ncbi:MAG TPA: pyrroline-5-carboxylate reductase [Atribacteraceae bacterium]|nr:pyrroline-5-carboxylate reductase [Atribacteraceae bacterium]
MIQNVLILGCGNMGGALVRGLCREKRLRKNRYFLYDVISERASELAAEFDLAWAPHLEEIPFTPTIVVLAFKPDDLSGAGIHLQRWPEAMFVSVLAGVSLSDLASALAGAKRIVRIMPNLAVEVGEGIVPVCFSPDMEQDRKEDFLFFLSTLGWIFETEEKHLASYTALSGSGPGFVSMFVEALADGGVSIGIPWETSLKLALQTVCGTAFLLKARGNHPGLLKNQVASPGGTTIAGIRRLEEGGLRAAVMNAVEASYRKTGMSGGERRCR